MKSTKALCLNMIVKDEMANLERCLSAAAPFIDCWVIADTGSTDGTQDFIRAFFAARGIPGELHSAPFENFAQARNEALALAKASSLSFDYLLLLDADMELSVQDSSFSAGLSSAAYRVTQRAGVSYSNIRLLRRDAAAGYRGVTHEFLDVHGGETADLDQICILDHETGSSRPAKLKRDLRLLVDALGAESEPVLIARYAFYLANTLRDAGQNEAALRMYLRRVELGGWRQEVFLSLLNAARQKEARDDCSIAEVVRTFRDAALICPGRVEALHGAARFCRTKGLYEEAYGLASRALKIERPFDALFSEDWIYDYGVLDEFAVSSYWTSRFAECSEACDRLLWEGKLPAVELARVQRNRQLAASGSCSKPLERSSGVDAERRKQQPRW